MDPDILQCGMRVFENVNRWLSHVEEKNSFLLVANGIFLGIIFNYEVKVEAGPIVVLIKVLLLGSVFFNILSFLPGSLLKFGMPGSRTQTGGFPANHLYYEDIARRFHSGEEYREYLKEIHGLNGQILRYEKVLDDYCHEIYQNAQITYYKTILAKVSVFMDIASVLILGACIIVG